MDNETCECGKINYPSHHAAGSQIVSLQKRNKGSKYGIYKCDRSGMFHITTSSKKLWTPKKEGKYPIRIEDYVFTKPPPEPRKKSKKKRK